MYQVAVEAERIKMDDIYSPLNTYVIENKNKSFSYGYHDCLTWVCGWIKLATGKDYLKKHKLDYQTKIGCYKKIKRLGYKSVEKLVDSELKEVNIMLAARGDVVLDASDATGICNGIHSHFITPKGLRLMKTYDLKKAWRLPR